MKYRVFIEDVGPNKFSAIRDAEAKTPQEAILKVVNLHAVDVQVIALPHSRRDLWPNGRTGKVPTEALGFSVASTRCYSSAARNAGRRGRGN